MSDYLPSSATSLGLGAISSVLLAAAGTSLLPVILGGVGVAALNYTKETEEAMPHHTNGDWIVDADGNDLSRTDMMSKLSQWFTQTKWWLNLLWKLGAMFLVFYFFRYVRNSYRADRKLAKESQPVGTPVAPAPVAPAPVVVEPAPAPEVTLP